MQLHLVIAFNEFIGQGRHLGFVRSFGGQLIVDLEQKFKFCGIFRIVGRKRLKNACPAFVCDQVREILFLAGYAAAQVSLDKAVLHRETFLQFLGRLAIKACHNSRRRDFVFKRRKIAVLPRHHQNPFRFNRLLFAHQPSGQSDMSPNISRLKLDRFLCQFNCFFAGIIRGIPIRSTGKKIQVFRILLKRLRHFTLGFGLFS